MAVLVKGGKVRTFNGKIRVGDAGESCCCGCCECSDELASAYTLEAPGTWDFTDCDNFRVPDWCDGAGTTLELEEFAGCQYGSDGPGFGEYCLDQYTLSLVTLTLICNRWVLNLVFFSVPNPDDPIPIVDGPAVVYVQRTPDCDDPMGIYDLYFSECGEFATVPETVTIS